MQDPVVVHRIRSCVCFGQWFKKGENALKSSCPTLPCLAPGQEGCAFCRSAVQMVSARRLKPFWSHSDSPGSAVSRERRHCCSYTAPTWQKGMRRGAQLCDGRGYGVCPDLQGGRTANIQKMQ